MSEIKALGMFLHYNYIKPRLSVFVICLILSPMLWGDDLANHSINSGGGWTTNNHNSNFTIIGEIYQSSSIDLAKLNQSPADIKSIDRLTISENLPIGSVVGRLIATDPDSNSLVFSLVTGLGDANNSLFSLEQNGTLKTAAILDYEAGNQLSIRVQVKDEWLSSSESNLTIQVSDLFLPVVDTAECNVVNNHLQLEAIMASFGPSGDDLSTGFYMSGETISDLTATGVSKILSTSSTDSTFTAITSANLSGGTYYYLAFAESMEGVRFGSEKSFVLPRITFGENWSDGSKVANYDYWWESDWFGAYNTERYPWVYHQNLGWVLVNIETTKGAWLYHQRLGWIWSEPDLFPHLYIKKGEQWAYLNTQLAHTMLYDFNQKEWFDANVPIQISGEISPQTGGKVSGYGDYFRWDKVSLKATSATAFSFAAWSGDLTSVNEVFEFDAIRDLKVNASFVATSSQNYSLEETVSDIKEVLNKMDHLSEVEKEKSLVELLIFGSSSTSGISIK